MSIKRKIYECCNRNWWQIIAALVVVIVALMLTFLAGCGYSSQEREQTHQMTRVTGTVAGLPMDATVESVGQRSMQSAGETDDTLFKALGQGITTALAGGSNLATGGAAGLAVGLLGMGVAWMRGRSATKAVADQRDELIDGAERSKATLETIKTGEDTTAWDHLKEALEAEQSKATKDAVKARVG